MRSLQTVLVKITMLLLLLCAAGLFAWFYPLEPVRDALASAWGRFPADPAVRRLIALIAGGVFGFIALYGLLPMPGRSSGRKVVFATENGTVTIALGPVYRKLKKIIRKMPEVHSCRLDIRPAEDGKTLQILADARLNKMPRQRGRDTARRVSHMIADAATGLLGVDALLEVDLNVRDFTVDTKGAVQALRLDHPAEEMADLVADSVPSVRIDDVTVSESSEEALPMPDPLKMSRLSVEPYSPPQVEEDMPMPDPTKMSQFSVSPFAESRVEEALEEPVVEEAPIPDAEPVTQAEPEPAPEAEPPSSALVEPELPPLTDLDEDEPREERDKRKDENDPWSL